MLTDVVQEYKDDINGVADFCEKIYKDSFDSHFSEVHNLYNKMKSKVNPIADSELEYILIMLPMELFTVAEKLNKLRLEQEVIKLKNKEKIEELRNRFISEAEYLNYNKTQSAEHVSRHLSVAMVEYEVLLAAYDSIITRVTNEQSFAKELIMGAKKVWDSRRGSEASNPVKPIAGDLPNYDPTSNKAYIK